MAGEVAFSIRLLWTAGTGPSDVIDWSRDRAIPLCKREAYRGTR